MERIRTLQDLENAIEELGFLPYSGNTSQMLFSLDDMTDNVWFDGSQSDPWQWRQCIASAGRQAYGKFFLKKSGFVAPRFLPAFIAVRRDNRSCAELYEEGLVSRPAKRVYDCFDEQREWTYQELKREAGYGNGASREFESALVELQMLFFLCISGQSWRINREGVPYGWPCNDFSRLDARFPEAAQSVLSREEGEEELLRALDRIGDFPKTRALRLLRGGSV